MDDEWAAALARDRPDRSPDRIARTRALMLAHVDDATLTLPDAIAPKFAP